MILLNEVGSNAAHTSRLSDLLLASFTNPKAPLPIESKVIYRSSYLPRPGEFSSFKLSSLMDWPSWKIQTSYTSKTLLALATFDMVYLPALGDSFSKAS